MLPTIKKISNHIETFMEHVCLDMVDILGRDLDFYINVYAKNVKRTIIASAEYKAKHMQYTINFDVKPFTRYVPIGVSEYDSYTRNPDIGGFLTDDWKLVCESVMLHEYAHIIHYHLKREEIDVPYFLDGYKLDTRPHGRTFRLIYYFLRKRYLNDRIPLEKRGVKTNYFEQNVIMNPYEDSLAVHHPEYVNYKFKLKVGGVMREYTVYGYNSSARIYKFMLRDNQGKLFKVSGNFVASCVKS